MTSKERPILFSGPMVRAILEGKKTQTRRAVKPQPTVVNKTHLGWRREHGLRLNCPYGESGDRLWVRETWALPPSYDPALHGDLRTKPRCGPVCYREQYSTGRPWPGSKWRPSIHMPRWACRLVLEVTSVRVERLQDISEEDAKAEGATFNEKLASKKTNPKSRFQRTRHIRSFERLWDGLNDKRGYGWDENPWVWVIELKR